MSCGDRRARFGRQLDGRLSVEQARELEEHLAGCEGCRAELARWRASSDALRALRPATVPVGLAERAWRAAVSTEETPGFLERFVAVGRQVALAGTLATLVAWAGLLVSGGSGGEASEPVPQDALELALAVWSTELSDAE